MSLPLQEFDPEAQMIAKQLRENSDWVLYPTDDFFEAEERHIGPYMNLWKSLYDNGILFGWEGKTSGIKNLLFDAFASKYHAPIPPSQLAKQFFDFAASIEQKKQSLLKENSKLETLRDWLLPMLMNGQVTVK